jgi:hypothetical protein
VCVCVCVCRQATLKPVVQVENQDVLYFSSRTDAGSVVLLEVTFHVGAPLQLCVRTKDVALIRALETTVDRLLRT